MTIHDTPLVPAGWGVQVILFIVNALRPAPILRFHVVALLPFIVFYVPGWMIVIAMILGKRGGADKTCG